MHNAQLLAAQVVAKVLSGRNLNQALDEARQPDFTPQQRGIMQDLSYGTLRWLSRLQALLSALLDRPLDDERVHYLLLVALYQLEYSKNASHAVVDHAVQAAATLNKPWVKGLVNGVLRNFLRQRETLNQNLSQKPSIQLAYPQWWVNKLQKQYPDDWEAMLKVGNQHPPMTLRINIRKTKRNDYLQQLMKEGIDAHLVGEFGLILEKPLPVEKLPGFSQGLLSVQDLGAQFAAPMLDVKAEMRVLDACSAPGGKAAHLLELADIELLALDSDEMRLQKVSGTLQRLGLKARVKAGDAAKPETWWNGVPFDRILADVPCTASGIVRRHPDIKWLRREADIASFCAQQNAILHSLWSTLAKGGKLLYATCSVFEEENHQQIQAFLASTADAKTLNLWEGLGQSGQLLPCDEHDGFFYALIQKM
ncbi:MAG: 16S rRNA (cytosine(967)-C(5))-methyltransferase RsmB [Methylophilales bacterium]|nr:16S rRNA (cytosine(967)-C(5))-methyltransferase RsmB [Methylophilales bacterium]